MTKDSMYKYAEKFSGNLEDILQEIADNTRKSLKHDDMLSGPVVAGLLRFLIHATGSRRILEIGMFTGYATIAMALSLPDDGKIITCESNLKYINLTKPFMAKSGVEHKIDIEYGDALNTLDRLDPYFDLIFIDADKENYLCYYEKCLPLLRSRGIIVADNAFLAGKVFDTEDRKGRTVHKLNTIMQSHQQLINVLLPVRDGIHVAMKL
jgi:caffeoyl-CoA O-methyltransferase